MRPQGSPLPSVLDAAGGQTRRWGGGRSGSLKGASEKRVGGPFPIPPAFCLPLPSFHRFPRSAVCPPQRQPAPAQPPPAALGHPHGAAAVAARGEPPGPQPGAGECPPRAAGGVEGEPPLWAAAPQGDGQGLPWERGGWPKTRRNTCPMQILLPSFSGRSFLQGVENECIYDGCTSWGWGWGDVTPISGRLASKINRGSQSHLTTV